MALDINLDMTCNAACVTCGPQSSSTWSKHLSNNSIIHIKTNFDYQPSLDLILNKIDLSNLRRVKFFGGEPLHTDSHLQVLKKIPYPEQVDIWYTTNASIFPTQEVLDVWSKFKLVFIEASIDGIADQFEYIRWPLLWNKVRDNLLELRAVGPVNLLFRINHTINPFNIYYYDRLEQWVNTEFSTNRLGDPTEINIHPCWGDWGLDRTPSTLREEIYKKYQDYSMSRLLKNSKQQNYDTILKFTDIWDPIRKNSWQATFPEIVKYFL
jgi:sulfatase maturation enzyme AslB (radical SAM superfamily)